MSRAVIFIDGAGLYASLREEFQKTRISLAALISKLVADRDLVRAYYYNALFPSEDKKEYAKQQRFLEAIKYIPHLEVRLGRVVKRGTSYYLKGVDVRMTTDILALADTYDVAILISGDDDFCAAVQVVKDRGKVVEVAFPKRWRSRLLAEASDAYIAMDESFLRDCWMTDKSQSQVIRQESRKALEFYKAKALPSQQSVLEILEQIGVINRAFSALRGSEDALITVVPQIAAMMYGACLDRTSFQHNVGLVCILLEWNVGDLSQLVQQHDPAWKGLRLLEQLMADRAHLTPERRASLDYLKKVIDLRNKMPPYHQPSAQVVEAMAALGVPSQPASAEEWQNSWDRITAGVLGSFRVISDALSSMAGQI